ncbi:hypothetical protein Misp06_00793 [Microbulbifer sp. NBRC 101763]|uniref:helix-turn-helix domain-containing protein n=1 Tax=Microbulbifer sp. NBRC 101763 TaxID=1113820 RepID=UPI0030B2D2EB
MFRIGVVVRQERTKRGLTQAELAEKLSIPLTHLQRIEQGRSKTVSPNLLRKIALQLDIDGNKLLSLPIEESPQADPLSPLPSTAKSHLIRFLNEISANLK